MKNPRRTTGVVASAAAFVAFVLAPTAWAAPKDPPVPDPGAYVQEPGDSASTADGAAVQEVPEGAVGPSGGETNLSGGSGSPNNGTHRGGNGTGADGQIGGLVGGSDLADEGAGGSGSDSGEGFDGGQVDLDSGPSQGALVP